MCGDQVRLIHLCLVALIVDLSLLSIISTTTNRYVPYVGDSKRAMDEYTSEIFMGGKVLVLSICFLLSV